MSRTPPDPLRDGRLLSQAIKAIRRLKRLSTREVAARMNMGVRTYQHFEAGRNKPNLEYIHRFCEVTEIDAFALLGALMIGSPHFARRTAENKLMTILMIGLQHYDEVMGDRILDQDPRTLILAVEALFERLIQDADERDADAKRWLAEGEQSLKSRRPKPGR
ncbi:MAG: helix-turn-helix domain-containing protein [Brevundimonas aurantiaca]|uniref:helix-turn-helix domain-containing protein n=1 Tax=Brevundimonas aurantiaca TaxID=74316 RepID=UPI00391AD886